MRSDGCSVQGTRKYSLGLAHGLAATAVMLIALLAITASAAARTPSHPTAQRLAHRATTPRVTAAKPKQTPKHKPSSKHKASTKHNASNTHKASTAPRASAATSPSNTSRSSAASGHSTQGSSSKPKANTKLLAAAHSGSVYWGAVTGSQFDNGGQAPFDMNVENDFVKADSLGKAPSIVPWYEPFTNCSSSPCTPYTFPTAAFNNVRDYGAIPMVSWASSSIQDGNYNGVTDKNFTLADVANGKFDAYITAWAQAAKAWGHPFFLRFDWEMNGNWFVWGANTNGNSPAEYVAAWRHVHDIFTKVGATNATWVWCPNNGDNTGSLASLASLYPGNAYVDWTCMDAYNFGVGGSGGTGKWESWDDVATGTYDAVQAIAPAKPMMVGEFNSADSGGSQAAWLAQALAEIPSKFPNVHAIVLFDTLQWELELHPASQLAFGTGIQNPAYTTDSYGNLDASPIPAP